MTDTYLPIKEAALYLGVSTKTLRRWEAKGLLTPQRTAGNQRRYLLAELDTFRFKKESSSPLLDPEPNEVPMHLYRQEPSVGITYSDTLPLLHQAEPAGQEARNDRAEESPQEVSQVSR